MDRAILNPAVRPRRAGPLRRLTRVAGLGVLVGALGACSGDVVRSLASDAGYGPRVVAAPDFVADTMKLRCNGHKAALARKLDSLEVKVKALEAELEGARGRNEARGRAAASAGRGAAATIKPAPAAPQ